MEPKAAYSELTKLIKEAALLESCSALLQWDQRAYMPVKGTEHRAEQLSLLATMTHERATHPRVGELLSELEGSPLAKDPETAEAVNIREMRRDYDRMTKLPVELVEEITRTIALSQAEWVEARKHSDFRRFLPWLEKVLDLTKRKAEAYGYEGEPYNALLEDYEPAATVEQVGKVFESLRGELTALLGKIKDAPRRPDPSILERSFEVDRQRVFGESVASAMGFDFDAGRLDVTVHPFCTTIGPGDTRILTRYEPRRMASALFGTMHEAGHGLYEMGIPMSKHFGLPMGGSVSLGIHESQSRLWENQVGRSKAFWKYFFPQARRLFRDALGGVSPEDFYAAINCVRPSFIRVESCEGTYNLHILLRFEIERALMRGDLKPSDVPGEWNSRFKKYLGVEVDSDRNGCLQDVHWSEGLIGYFPTYTLGNLYAAQFFAKVREEMPDLESKLERGDLLPLRDWLREKIHVHARRYPAMRLCEKVTGRPLDHRPLMDYLKGKYAEIYGI